MVLSCLTAIIFFFWESIFFHIRIYLWVRRIPRGPLCTLLVSHGYQSLKVKGHTRYRQMDNFLLLYFFVFQNEVLTKGNFYKEGAAGWAFEFQTKLNREKGGKREKLFFSPSKWRDLKKTFLFIRRGRCCVHFEGELCDHYPHTKK